MSDRVVQRLPEHLIVIRVSLHEARMIWKALQRTASSDRNYADFLAKWPNPQMRRERDERYSHADVMDRVRERLERAAIESLTNPPPA